MLIPKVSNMQSPNGNDVPNQFIIDDGEKTIFQSYDSIIAIKWRGKVYLDSYYHDYSRTTVKYRNIFLGANSGEVAERIESGEYTLADLTKGFDPLTRESFTRVSSDSNGNPRYAIHFLQCLPDSAEGSLEARYAEAVRLMNTIGGRKFHNKQFGGGIVFQSYSLDSTIEDIERVKREA